MGKISLLVTSVILLLASCGRGGAGSAGGIEVPSEIKVGGVVLEMVSMEPGTFGQGFTPSGLRVRNAPSFQAVMSGYSISRTPVTVELWNEVMKVSSGASSGPASPVDMVSYKDCKKFISRLSGRTGIPFSLPSESQWEYAVLNGMAGTVPGYSEWCADSYAEESASGVVEDPVCLNSSSLKVVRNPSERMSMDDYAKSPKLTFRLAVNTMEPVPDDVRRLFIDKVADREYVSSDETVQVGKVKFRMIGVPGGAFEMGATKEQEKAASEDELPVHQVTLRGFEIGETEVTSALWLEVMGRLPYGNSENAPDCPVVNVSWYGCQEFILRLNRLTGRKFRLPTEAEWEFAARGGARSLPTLVSGGHYTREVAAYVDNSKSSVVPVASFRPNALGIYDMSGNAWEWCQDSYAAYSADPVADPYVNSNQKYRVMRGGSAASRWDACRVSNRSAIPPNSVKSTFGFRLAL